MWGGAPWRMTRAGVVPPVGQQGVQRPLPDVDSVRLSWAGQADRRFQIHHWLTSQPRWPTAAAGQEYLFGVVICRRCVRAGVAGRGLAGRGLAERGKLGEAPLATCSLARRPPTHPLASPLLSQHGVGCWCGLLVRAAGLLDECRGEFGLGDAARGVFVHVGEEVHRGDLLLVTAAPRAA